MAMSSATGCSEPLPPILKHTSRRWKELSAKGSSVGINDPCLKQGFLGNLSKKTDIELEELLMRQDKLLSDANFLSKLQDGGAKLRGRRLELLKALDAVRSNSTDVVLPDVSALEWQWRDTSKHVSNRYQGTNDKYDCSLPDSDDDSDHENDDDPLRLLAGHSQDVPIKINKTVAGFPPDTKPPLLDPADAIREELCRLDIADLLNSNKSNDCNNQNGSGEKKLSADFCAKLLLSYEKKLEKNVNKNVFKPFRPRDKQELLPKHDSKIIESSGKCKNEKNASLSSCNNMCKVNCSNPNETLMSTCAETHPAFGSAAQFSGLKPVNVSATTWHRSPLWRNESSATGPLRSFGEVGRVAQLLPVRESLALERAAHERRLQLHLQEAGDRVSQQNTCSNTVRRYHYTDINQQGRFFGDQEDYGEGDLLNFTDNQYRRKPSDDEQDSSGDDEVALD